MADRTQTAKTQMAETQAASRHGSRHGPDVLALLFGLLALGMSAAAFVGELPSLAGFDPRWLLAAGAAVVGLLLLMGSIRGRGRP